jgi:hypothetical protein
VLAMERKVKTSAIIVLALATALSGSRVYAQTEQPTIHHHYHVHHHHRVVAHGPAPTLESTAAVQRPEVVGSPQPNQMFRPYAHPGDGDNDGLSRDPDDCMKGCIGGNPQ